MRKFTTIIILFCTLIVNAQKQQVQNLPQLDRKRLHFGFTIGTNIMDFTIDKADNFFNTNQVNRIYAIENTPSAGFLLGPVSNLRLNDFFDLRLLINLSFGQRNLAYLNVDSTATSPVLSKHLMKLSSTYIEFPLLLKYKAMRLNNVSPYLLTGINPRIDLASQKGINESEKPKIKLSRYDLAYEIGAGIDFYLPYFRFSTELKYSVGMLNALVRDGTQYTSSIKKMNSRIWMISFHFEG